MEVSILLNQAFAEKKDRLTPQRIQEFVETGSIGDHRRDHVIPFDQKMYDTIAKEFEGGK